MDFVHPFRLIPYSDSGVFVHPEADNSMAGSTQPESKGQRPCRRGIGTFELTNLHRPMVLAAMKHSYRLSLYTFVYRWLIRVRGC